MDWVVVIALSLSFGALVTSHLALCVGVARQEGLWRAALALVIPPLALIWGFSHRMFVRSAIWLLGAVVYLVALIAASSGA
jgi:hypothetical protein